MKFKIIFEYMDGTLFEEEVDSDNIKEFFDCINKGDIYFNRAKGLGLWIPLSKIRHFKVEAIDGKGKRIKRSNRKLSKSDGDIQPRALGDKKEGDEGMENSLPSPKSFPVTSDGGVEEQMTF